MSCRLASAAAAIIRSHSAAVVAIGFSHSTCLPAFSPRTVYSACRLLGRVMYTTCTHGPVVRQPVERLVIVDVFGVDAVGGCHPVGLVRMAADERHRPG